MTVCSLAKSLGESTVEEVLATLRVAHEAPDVFRGAVKGGPQATMRESVLGFDSITDVRPGEEREIEQVPQVPFKGQMLFVDPDCASFFDLADIRIGRMSQFPSAAPVPASVFALRNVVEPNQSGLPLEIDAAEVAQKIVLRVCNVGNKPARFRGAISGLMLVLGTGPASGLSALMHERGAAPGGARLAP